MQQPGMLETANHREADAANKRTGPITLKSEDLFQDCREVLIEHGNETYRLRLTRSGKLILNK